MNSLQRTVKSEQGKSSNVPAATPTASTGDVDEFQAIRRALHGLRYGALTIIVQDGVIVQIDRLEKMRFQRSKT
jgi:hypothetical protein